MTAVLQANGTRLVSPIMSAIQDIPNTHSGIEDKSSEKQDDNNEVEVESKPESVLWNRRDNLKGVAGGLEEILKGQPLAR